MFRSLSGLFGFALLPLLVGAAWAAELPTPEGDVILTVRGNISLKNATDGAAFDLDMIEEMGPVTVKTGTIWTDGTREFEGIELSRLMTRLGAKGETLRLVALNDYAVEIPMSEAVDGGPMLAYRMDGVVLSPRDKGPLWMIYPFDPRPEYKNEVSYSRSVWQLIVIEVLP